jgi:hypothetical protein
MEVLSIVRNGADELRLRSEELCLDQSGSAMVAKRTATMSIGRCSNGKARRYIDRCSNGKARRSADQMRNAEATR